MVCRGLLRKSRAIAVKRASRKRHSSPGLWPGQQVDILKSLLALQCTEQHQKSRAITFEKVRLETGISALAFGHDSRQKFSKVCSLLNVLCKVNAEHTFENSHHLAPSFGQKFRRKLSKKKSSQVYSLLNVIASRSKKRVDVCEFFHQHTYIYVYIYIYICIYIYIYIYIYVYIKKNSHKSTCFSV